MNTAGRLLALYDRLVGTSRANDVVMLNVWAEVFDLPDGPNLEDEVVTCLQAVRSEMEGLQARLKSMGVIDDLLRPGWERLRNITSTAYISQIWKGLRDEASRPENRIPFAWANWVLREESEDDMAPDELSSLRNELDALEASLRGTEMTVYMRGFIQRQLNSIRTALRLYPIRGVKPIEEAARQVVGTCNIEASVLAKEFERADTPAKGVFAKVGHFIEKTAKVADNLDKIRKAGEGAYALSVNLGPVFLTWAQALSR